MNDSERDQLLTQATQAHQAGNFQRAEADYRQLWEEKQDDNVSYLLGTLLLQKGDAKQAIEFLSPIAARNLRSADLQNNLGVAYQMVENPEQALLAFQAAIKADRKYPQVYHNLGKLLVEVGNLVEAEKCYRQFIQMTPDDFECRQEWIQVLNQLEMWEDSVREINFLLQSDPHSTNLRSNLVYSLAQLHRYEEAMKHAEKILEQTPDSVELLSNLSYLYEHSGKIDQAVTSAEKASKLAPNSAEVANNLGVAYRSAHQIDKAIEAFQKALQITPDFSLARFNLGSTQLLDEQYPAGWENYECRQQLMTLHPAMEAIPRWKGEKIEGKKLLVWCDQGFGDALEFCRFLPRIKQESCAEVVCQVPPELLELFKGSTFQGSPLADAFLSEDDSLPELDYQFPLTSIGELLRLTVDEIGITEPYLQAPNSEKKETQSGKRRIGLCWRGNPKQSQDHVRTVELSRFHSLTELENVEWVSFQLDATDQELEAWPGEIEDCGRKLNSFSETAQELEKLDLLLTVDTAMAHLAGAMIAPVWTMLAHTPDWRWHLERKDSPWYPDMKLIRQPTWGDWDNVVLQVKEALQSGD